MKSIHTHTNVKWTRVPSSVGSLSKCLKTLWPGQSQEPMEWQEPKNLSHHLKPPCCILARSWVLSSQSSNESQQYGTWVSQMVTLLCQIPNPQLLTVTASYWFSPKCLDDSVEDLLQYLSLLTQYCKWRYIQPIFKLWKSR